MSSAINYLLLFYKKIYLFCSQNSIKNLKKLFNNQNIEYITYEKWYDYNNIVNKWPSVTNDWYEVLCSIQKNINNFDWIKYTNYYSDLNNINNKADAWNHWINFGKNENRMFFENFTYEYINFDWIKYTTYYLDLNKINNKADAWNHWIKFGKYENRIRFVYNMNLEIDDFIISGNVYKTIDTEKIETTNKIIEFKNKITNTLLIKLNNNINDITNYSIPYYKYIINFYEDINLDVSIYYDYFNIDSSLESINYYDLIKNYKLVFLHFVSSCGQTYIPDDEWLHVYNDEYLIINPDKNHYNIDDNPIKYELSNKYLNLLALDYIDIIYNATDIYVCVSCFANIVFPLRIKNKLKAKNIIIYDRFYPNEFHSLLKPIVI